MKRKGRRGSYDSPIDDVRSFRRNAHAPKYVEDMWSAELDRRTTTPDSSRPDRVLLFDQPIRLCRDHGPIVVGVCASAPEPVREYWLNESKDRQHELAA